MVQCMRRSKNTAFPKPALRTSQVPAGTMEYTSKLSYPVGFTYNARIIGKTFRFSSSISIQRNLMTGHFLTAKHSQTTLLQQIVTTIILPKKP